VLVTHDRSLLDRLCTEILGLDGQGGARIFSDYSQWTAAQQQLRETQAKAAKSPAKTAMAPREKTRRLSFHEQRELDGIEERILAAEAAVRVREQEVEAAGRNADHVQLQESCHALQEAHAAVEQLYGRWQELEAKRT
jgi:ATP-binding cassette subfamily F protein uup